MKEVAYSALIKAIRTFVQAFASTLVVSAVGIVDVSTARAVVLGAGAAALAAVWRAFDTAPVPTLVDPYPAAGVPH